MEFKFWLLLFETHSSHKIVVRRHKLEKKERWTSTNRARLTSSSTESTRTSARTRKQRSVMKIWHGWELLSCRAPGLFKLCASSRRRGRSERLTSVSLRRKKKLSRKRSSSTRKRSTSWRSRGKFWQASLPTSNRSSRINRSERRRMSVSSSSIRPPQRISNK